MKASNRKTGEIVDVIFYSQLSEAGRSSQDYVSYIDSKGVEHEKESLNYYWDFEPIDNTQDEDLHWQDVKERAAIAALQGLLANPSLVGEHRDYLIIRAKICAEELVEKLKEK